MLERVDALCKNHKISSMGTIVWKAWLIPRSVPGSEIVGKARRENEGEKRVGARERQQARFIFAFPFQFSCRPYYLRAWNRLDLSATSVKTSPFNLYFKFTIEGPPWQWQIWSLNLPTKQITRQQLYFQFLKGIWSYNKC